MLCWNLPSGPKHRGWLTLLFLKGISSFAGDFVLIWMKQRLIWFNLQRGGARNGFYNIKKTFTENLQLKSMFTWDPKWPQNGLKFHFWIKFPFSVRKLDYQRSHDFGGVKLTSVNLIEVKFQTAVSFPCKQ